MKGRILLFERIFRRFAGINAFLFAIDVVIVEGYTVGKVLLGHGWIAVLEAFSW